MQVTMVVMLYDAFLCILVESFGGWDDSGCVLLSENQTTAVCQCNHLTHFALLLVCCATVQICTVFIFYIYIIININIKST